MYRKVILSVVLMAFVSLQLANSLRCYQCNDVTSCRNPISVECDQIHADATRNISRMHYQDVHIMNSTHYSCFISAYNATNVTVMELQGCIMTGTVDCISKLKNPTLTRDTCRVCQTDFCNIKNSTKVFTSTNANVPQYTNNSHPIALPNTPFIPQTNTNNIYPFVPQTNKYNNTISQHNNTKKPVKNSVNTFSSSIPLIISLSFLIKVFVI